jgi:hypothetical protein
MRRLISRAAVGAVEVVVLLGLAPSAAASAGSWPTQHVRNPLGRTPI